MSRVKFVRFLPLILLALSASAAEFNEEVERVIAIRTNGHLQITNNRGDVVIEGWTQDKIRLRVKRKAMAETKEEAKRLFAAADIGSRTLEGNIEVFAEYGKGLTLQERLQERSNPRTRMEMNVLAPARLPLRVWAVNGKVVLKGWKSSVEIRSGNGPIDIDGVKGESVSILCPSCSIKVKNVKGKLRCMGGAGAIEAANISGEHVYMETDSGAVFAENIDGEQLYVSKSGAISVRMSHGRVEFHTQQGAFELLRSEGFVSGKTFSGNITIGMRDWEFSDKALLESVNGRISLGLPSTFSGELDAWSVHGKLILDFPLRTSDRNPESGRNEAGRHIGIAGRGGELLRVFSLGGDVTVSTEKD